LKLLNFLDTDHHEQSLFSQFNNSQYWTTIIRNSGVPDNTSINWFSFTAPDGIPAIPGLYTVLATGVPNLHAAYYGGTYAESDEKVQASILEYISNIAKVAGFPPSSTPPQFEDFKAHTPFELTVSTKSIENGFYNKLNGLQGRKNTFWTGATWQAQDSSAIWNFTEYHVLPNLLKAL
jgi:hypothetical protein